MLTFLFLSLYEKKRKKEKIVKQRKEEERQRKRQLEYDAAQAGVQLNKQANIDERKLKRDGKIQKKIAEMDRIEKEKIAKRRKKKEDREKAKEENFKRLIRPKKKKKW